VLHQAGGQLISLAVLLGLVNGLEVLVYHQELESDYMLPFEPGKVLMWESPFSAMCALLGMIPACTSPSRTRIALQHTGVPSRKVPLWHAGAMLLVALSGHLWLHLLPYACLAGALFFAGWRLIPPAMLSRSAPAGQPGALWQGWLVAGFFAFVGGATALLVGLLVSTSVLLRASATHAIRRIHLEGKLRSRHVRRSAVDTWLGLRMHQVAVFELQGIVSFGVVALVVEQVRKHLGEHRCVILDTARVPAWDDTGFERLRGLARELKARGVALVVCGVRGGKTRALGDVPYFEYLDLALEWAENQILRDCPPGTLDASESQTPMGDLGEVMPAAPRLALEARLKREHYARGELVFRSGDQGRSLMLVQQGRVVLSTVAVIDQGLRLAVIGPGMVFGEMAFLSGSARTAFAIAGQDGATVCSLEWADYQAWARDEPDAALIFMSQLARMEIRRLGNTTQELRAAME
jgi:SulP family sulfate permease